MSKDYYKKQFIVNRQSSDTLTWEGTRRNQPDLLVDCNMEPYVKYTVDKHKRWELMEEVVKYMQQEPANPNHMILTAAVQPYNSSSRMIAMTNTHTDGAVVFGPHANARSVLAKADKESDEERSKISSTHRRIRQKRGQHRDHHRPGERSRQVDFSNTGSEENTNEPDKQPEISSLVLELKYMPKKKFYYRYTRRWRLGELVKDNRKCLQAYAYELIRDGPKELVDQACNWTESETDEELMNYEPDIPISPKQIGKNLFLNDDGTLITNKFTIHISSIMCNPFVDGLLDASQIDRKDSKTTVDVQHSAHTFAIDLSTLLGSTLNANSVDCNKPWEVNCTNWVDYHHVAYLILRENPTKDEQSNQSSDSQLFSVQLQISLLPDQKLPVRNELNERHSCQSGDTITLDALIQEAVQALRTIPATCFNRKSCHPYEPYELKDPQIGLAVPAIDDEDSISVLSQPITDDEESSFIVVDHLERKPSGKCVLCNKPVTEKSIELCVNLHQACPGCLEDLIVKKLDYICCGLTVEEVCWVCPQEECSAPLLRVAQLQSIPLCQLAPVWKCADFLSLCDCASEQRSSNSLIFYTNPDVVPGAVLVIKSENQNSVLVPNRPMNVTFSPSKDRVSVIPKLYFTSSVWGQMHSPASCDIVRRFHKLQGRLDDFSSTDPSSKPAVDGIHPFNLPSPDDIRTEAYCNALAAAWRQNFTRRLLRLDYAVVKPTIWKEDSTGVPISIGKTSRWLGTLGEIQSLVKYSFVLAHFEPDHNEYLDWASELMQKEICLGEALKLYPLIDRSSVTITAISPAIVEQFVNSAQHLHSRFFRGQN
ncbi:hypothetical protein D915_004786 [Fasciola hepatica]|uniref:Uncharacterized protein n=1 Tax=Fasciola hepatica TaxID=6192 RepID=A0A4E0R755_FASHE|nr:hypothetical protein D915_004786 [Fasciola hepatica]